jgi:hypothetical protein
MEMLIEDAILTEDKILKTNEGITKEKENKLVNLIVEIIVSVTLKEYYEKSD